MDGDEVFALIGSTVVALSFFLRWYGALISVRSLVGHVRARLVLAVIPLACLAGLQFVLAHYAAHEVHEDPQYDLLFLAGGGAWIAVATWSMQIVGLSARDDAIESRNPAALTTLCGCWIAMTICYSAGNIGEGPTIWTTFFPAAAASGALLFLWLLLAATTRSSEAIAIDRDRASAVRLVGFLIAAAIIFGAAVAGNWTSWEETWRDFLVQSWPVIIPFLITALLQVMWRPSPNQPFHPVIRRGVIPAIALIACSVWWLILSRRFFTWGDIKW